MIKMHSVLKPNKKKDCSLTLRWFSPSPHWSYWGLSISSNPTTMTNHLCPLCSLLSVELLLPFPTPCIVMSKVLSLRTNSFRETQIRPSGTKNNITFKGTEITFFPLFYFLLWTLTTASDQHLHDFVQSTADTQLAAWISQSVQVFLIKYLSKCKYKHS